MPGEGEEAVKYQGRYYRLSPERNVYLPDKSVDERYYILTLFAVAKDKNGKVVAVFVNANNVPDGATDNTVYGVISAYDGRVKDYF